MTQPIPYTDRRLRSFLMLQPTTPINIRERTIARLNRLQEVANAKQREKEELIRQQRYFQQQYEKEQKRLRDLEAVRLIQAIAKREADARAKKAEELKLKRSAAAKKAWEKRKAAEQAKINNVVKLNTVVNLSGVLTDFDIQIELPLMIGLNTLVGVKDAHFHMTYGTNGVINELFKPQGNDGTSIYWNNLKQYLMVYADGELVPVIPAGASFHIVILKADNISPAYIKQIYRDGEVHCVLNPLYTMWIKMARASESNAAKKRLIQIAKRLKGMEKKYPNGVPEDDMEKIGKICRRCIVIHDIIGNVTKRYNSSCTKMVHFTNTRLNHLEQGHLTLDKTWIMVSAEEMEQILKEHNDNNYFYLFDGNLQSGICQSLRSVRGAWSVENPEREIFSEFSKSQGIQHYGINPVKYPELNAFVKEARIINSAPTPLCEDPNDMEGVEHIDVEKAYTQHKHAPFYSGFMGHITNWRRLTNIDIDFINDHVGIFQFRVLTNPSVMLKKLGLRIGTVYTLPSPEIRYFISQGMTVRLLAGCWGSTFDLEYTPEMLENRRYCTWAGKQGSDHPEQSFTMKGNREWAAYLKHELGDEYVLYFADMEMIVVKVPKKFYQTRHHILAFITSYCRLNMMSIMEKVEGELVKVVLDGLYYRGAIPDIEIPHKIKEKRTHIGFRDAWYYPSEIDTSQWAEYNPSFDGSAVLAGAGGCGKSYSVFTDKGLIKPLYVVPSHVLGRKMQMSHTCTYTTIHKFIGNECRSFKEDHYEPAVAFIDELTMIDADWIEKAVKMYPHTMFLIAGDIDEKQWYQCRNGCPGKFSKVWIPNWKYIHYTTDYRSKCEELKACKMAIRDEMKRIFTDGNSCDNARMMLFMYEKHKVLPFTEAVKQHVVGDTWIAGTHRVNKLLLDKDIVSGFINSDKEIVKEGEGEKRGSFTIHSFQGLTIDEGKVFICVSDAFEYAMIYTAVSRCVRMDQVVFFRA